jgi:Domain of unknown function (DUF5063)
MLSRMGMNPISATLPVQAFVDVARRFCDLVDRADTLPASALLEEGELRLLELYTAALSLPDPEPSSDELRSDSISHQDWLVVFRRLQSALGPHDFYREIFDPAAMGDPGGSIDTGDEPVVSSLADDLADIWRDLRAGLNVWDGAADVARSDIVVEWHESFVSHWGQHLVDGLRAIHWWRHVHHVGRTIDAPEA